MPSFERKRSLQFLTFFFKIIISVSNCKILNPESVSAVVVSKLCVWALLELTSVSFKPSSSCGGERSERISGGDSESTY